MSQNFSRESKKMIHFEKQLLKLLKIAPKARRFDLFNFPHTHRNFATDSLSTNYSLLVIVWQLTR